MELKVQDVSVTLNNKLILDSLNLEVREGELISLLGPSGCGKSTLLKTIAGLLTPQSGEIILNNEIVNNRPSNSRGTVIVFQDLRLFPNMTVEENIAFPLKIRGINKASRMIKAKKLLKSVHLEGFENRKINEMSGGQLQRVALARALAANPQILLLDEPFSSLDDNLRHDMRRLVLDLHHEYAITTVLVTHDQQEALMMSNRIALMMEGKIIQYDTPQIIYNAPLSKTVADYFGGGNYIDGEVKERIFESGIVSFPVPVSDGKYIALFRPSALSYVEQNDEYQIVGIEYLGEKWNITVEGRGRKFALALTTDRQLKIGGKIGLSFDCSKAVIIPQ